MESGRYENVSFSVTLTKMSFLIHDLSLMSARLDVSTKMSLFMITTELYLKYVILTGVTSSFARPIDAPTLHAQHAHIR